MRVPSKTIASRDNGGRRTDLHERLSVSTPRKVPEVIDLCDKPLEEVQGFSSDIFLPSPIRPLQGEQAGLQKTTIEVQPPRVQLPKVVLEKPAIRDSEPRRSIATTRNDSISKQPAVSDIANQLPTNGRATSLGAQLPSTHNNPAANRPPTVALRMAPSIPRKKKALLCQNQLLSKPSPNGNVNGTSQQPFAAQDRQPLRMWTLSPEPLLESEPEPAMLDDFVDPKDSMALQDDTVAANPCTTKDHVDEVSMLQQRNTSPGVSPAEIRKAAAASARKKSPATHRPATVTARSRKAVVPEPPPVDLVLEAQLIDVPNNSEQAGRKAPALPYKVAKKTASPAVTVVPAVQKDLGPWSREAFDLFAWRPPGWNEQNWCLETET
jgi:hypothetical protein